MAMISHSFPARSFSEPRGLKPAPARLAPTETGDSYTPSSPGEGSPLSFPRTRKEMEGWHRTHQTMSDANVGRTTIGGDVMANVKGYGIDFDGNGQFDNGKDGVLVFDTNKDGRYDANDVRGSNDLMKAGAGNYDLDGDGKITQQESQRGKQLAQQYRALDKNRDGKLDNTEMKNGGGKIWVGEGRIKEGKAIAENELYSPDKVKTGIGTRTVNWVDPTRAESGSTWSFMSLA